MEFKVQIRPFLNRPAIAYELVLIRTEGNRLYDRRIAIISGTDAGDIALACPTVEFIRAPSNYLEDPHANEGFGKVGVS